MSVAQGTGRSPAFPRGGVTLNWGPEGGVGVEVWRSVAPSPKVAGPGPLEGCSSLIP